MDLRRRRLHQGFYALKIVPIFLFLFALAMGVLASEEKDTLVIDRFTEGLNEEGLPLGWSLEKKPGSHSRIALEGKRGNQVLHLLSVGDSFGIKKEIFFDLSKYPYLTWRWKVLQLPRGGDIRHREADDQAGQIYVIFPRFPNRVNSLSLGYIWDTSAPPGLAGTSTAYSRMKFVVLQSGPAKLNQWVLETRNVYEDFKKLFPDERTEVGAVLLYINSQYTKSSAECYYENIFFSSLPPKVP